MEAAISEILEPNFSKERVSIIVPKSITEVGESDLLHALVSRFVGVRPPIELIKSWMKECWSTKGLISLVTLPREFLIFKFQFEEDLQNVIELGPWFLEKKGLLIKRWDNNFTLEYENFNLIPTWVSLLGLHPSCWHASVITKIEKVIKTLVTIERATQLRQNLIDVRFIANIDISKLLRKEIKILTKDGRSWV